jgi:hypothetical protein
MLSNARRHPCRCLSTDPSLGHAISASFFAGSRRTTVEIETRSEHRGADADLMLNRAALLE